MLRLILFLFFIIHTAAYPQVLLEADGPGNTYELISSKLAPGYDAVENPECIHPSFGRHIAEVWDADLNKYVFEFYIHKTPDNDRCINTDRQRIEIKTYEPSPDNLKGTTGETITYKWKFKIPVGFQPSSSFTHIHQIKAVGGDEDMPIITLTPRKGSPNKMELIHDNVKKATSNLTQFEGVWVECTEVIKVGASGTYSMVIKRVNDGTVIMSYSNNNIMTIRPDNSFIRPKWGIYRSLNNASDLRDESIRFDGFSIKEGTTGLPAKEKSSPGNFSLEQNFPNPFNPVTRINYYVPKVSKIRLAVFDTLGKEVNVLVDGIKSAGKHTADFDASDLISGVYYYQLSGENSVLTGKMSLIK